MGNLFFGVNFVERGGFWLVHMVVAIVSSRGHVQFLQEILGKMPVAQAAK
jgi:hypothetical protein